MAKQSKIAKNERRRLVVARYAVQRAALKAVIRDPRTPPPTRNAAPRGGSWVASRATRAPPGSVTGTA